MANATDYDTAIRRTVREITSEDVEFLTMTLSSIETIKKFAGGNCEKAGHFGILCDGAKDSG